MQAGARPLGEEAAEEAEYSGPRADVSQDDAQHGFLAARELIGIGPQMLQLADRQLRSRMEQAALVGQVHPVTAAVEQPQAELLFKSGNGGEHGGMSPVQSLGRGLEAALR